MLVAFSVAPSGGGTSDSVHDAVAAAVRVVRDSGLPHRTDAMFTTIEGEWDECLAVVKAAVEAVGAYGTRTSLVLKADIRPGRTGELDAKVERLEAALARLDDATADEPAGGPGQEPSDDRTGDDGSGDDGAAGRPDDAHPTHADGPVPAPAAAAATVPVAAATTADAGSPTPARTAAAPEVLEVLARFVAAEPLVILDSGGDAMLPPGGVGAVATNDEAVCVRCRPNARVLVTDAAPPAELNLVELSRTVVRTPWGRLRAVTPTDEVYWSDEVGADSVTVAVWADAPSDPSGVWVELAP